jgi:hypothetical protein
MCCSGLKAIDQRDAAFRWAFHENVRVLWLTPRGLDDRGADGLRSWSVTLNVRAGLCRFAHTDLLIIVRNRSGRSVLSIACFYWGIVRTSCALEIEGVTCWWVRIDGLPTIMRMRGIAVRLFELRWHDRCRELH